MVSPQTIASDECFVAGSGETVDAYAIVTHWFHGRPFVSMLYVRPDSAVPASAQHCSPTWNPSATATGSGSQPTPTTSPCRACSNAATNAAASSRTIPELVYSKLIS